MFYKQLLHVNLSQRPLAALLCCCCASAPPVQEPAACPTGSSKLTREQWIWQGNKGSIIAGQTCRPDVQDAATRKGEAAPAPNSLISARQREIGGGSRPGSIGELTEAEGVCSVTGYGFNPKHLNLQIGARAETCNQFRIKVLRCIWEVLILALVVFSDYPIAFYVIPVHFVLLMFVKYYSLNTNLSNIVFPQLHLLPSHLKI